jgi:hypothetical protein
MRRVRFRLWDRMVLIPVELVGVFADADRGCCAVP